MQRLQVAYGPAGNPRASSWSYPDPRLVNTRLMLRRQREPAACAEYTITSGDCVFEAGRKDREDPRTVLCLTL